MEIRRQNQLTFVSNDARLSGRQEESASFIYLREYWAFEKGLKAQTEM